MDRREDINLGDQIKDVVQDAVHSMNFGQLNKNIEDSINIAMGEVKKNLSIAKNTHSMVRQAQKSRTIDMQKKVMPPAYKLNEAYAVRPAGKIAGTVLMTLGIIGIVGSAAMTLVFGILALVGVESFVFTILLLALAFPFLGATITMTAIGSGMRNRVRRFQDYKRILNGRLYCSIKDLAQYTHQTSKYILKDLQKMIQLRMFPQGHIDYEEECLILTNQAMKEYEEAKQTLRLRQEEQKLLQQQEEVQTADEKELQRVISEGENYVRQIIAVNDAIPEEEFTRKLYRLEQIIKKIFEYVGDHPGQLPEIRKFMDYYLPTTLKLVNAYKEFDDQPVKGQNITTAKEEIRRTLDTINAAFENLFDNLYQDAAMDISTDISVLETLLAQEGLTENDFRNQELTL